MARHVVMLMVSFDGDALGDATATANAKFIADQARTLAQQSAVLDQGTEAERTSYALCGEVQPDGTVLAATGTWHLDEFGIVRDGRPVALPPGAAPAWIQPTGAQDSYPLDAEVMHNGVRWRSTHAGANSWEPGVFGWVQV